MRRYELMLLLRPDLEDDKLQAAVEKVTRAIVNAGGALSKVSPWGKRRLAYEISRHREASYFLIHFDIEPAEIREIERGMLISEEILRHLVTVLEDRGPADDLPPAAAARPSEAPAVEGGADSEAAADSDVGADEPTTSESPTDADTGEASAVTSAETDSGDEPGADADPETADEERAEG